MRLTLLLPLPWQRLCLFRTYICLVLRTLKNSNYLYINFFLKLCFIGYSFSLIHVQFQHSKRIVIIPQTHTFWHRFPTPLILKLPGIWRFSSLRYTWNPAHFDKGVLWTVGVTIWRGCCPMTSCSLACSSMNGM